jgi:hypothetical protein
VNRIGPGKNEQTKKVFWTFFIATVSFMLAQVLALVAVQTIAEILAGIVVR